MQFLSSFITRNISHMIQHFASLWLAQTHDVARERFEERNCYIQENRNRENPCTRDKVAKSKERWWEETSRLKKKIKWKWNWIRIRNKWSLTTTDPTTCRHQTHLNWIVKNTKISIEKFPPKCFFCDNFFVVVLVKAKRRENFQRHVTIFTTYRCGGLRWRRHRVTST